jgi:hypothetical protein
MVNQAEELHWSWYAEGRNYPLLAPECVTTLLDCFFTVEPPLPSIIWDVGIAYTAEPLADAKAGNKPPPNYRTPW